MSEVSWNQEQRAKITKAIDDATNSSRLADKLIPEFELKPSDRAVTQNQYIYPNPAVVPPIVEGINENFVALQDSAVPVILTKLQVEDSDLEQALTRVTRAAKQLARNHDTAVFGTAIRNVLNANAPPPGAAPVPGYHNLVPINENPPAGSGQFGDGLMAATAAAIAALDGEGYRSGFAMVAGPDVYRLLHTRVLGAAEPPIKAVKGLIEDGPVHRSAVLPVDEALILSITDEGKEIDRAVAVRPTLEFLRTPPGMDDSRDFRLYERFLTRFKQTYSVVLLSVCLGSS